MASMTVEVAGLAQEGKDSGERVRERAVMRESRL